LIEAVALFNRQSGKRLVLVDDATGALRITGVFWTDDPEGFSRLLAASLGLKADTDAQGRIVLRE
jgi:ferric-dicitrate binding protein FerR (iron transport regulator)